MGAASDAEKRREWSNVFDWSGSEGCTDCGTSETLSLQVCGFSEHAPSFASGVCSRRFLRILESVGGSERGCPPVDLPARQRGWGTRAVAFSVVGCVLANPLGKPDLVRTTASERVVEVPVQHKTEGFVSAHS